MKNYRVEFAFGQDCFVVAEIYMHAMSDATVATAAAEKIIEQCPQWSVHELITRPYTVESLSVDELMERA